MDRVRSWVRRYFPAIFVLFYVVVGAGLSPQVGADPPGYAQVILDEAHGRYYPALARYAKLAPAPGRITTVDQARQAGYVPDPQALRWGSFSQWSSLIGDILSRSGLLHRPSRWNPDGSWNW